MNVQSPAKPLGLPAGTNTFRQHSTAGAPPGRQQVNQHPAERFDAYQAAGSAGRGQFDAAFPNLGPMLASMEATDLLPPSQIWSVLESTSWLASTPYHGLRRLKRASRERDTLAIFNFLCREAIFEVNGNGNYVIHRGRTGNNLLRRNIQKDFYWLWKSQVEKLGEFISRESRRPPGTGLTIEEAKREIDDCL